MGHFSVPCGLSGLPIQYSQRIVGFQVEPVRFGDRSSYWEYVPRSFPVRGTYDDYGCLEDEKSKTLLEPDKYPIVLIHEELWDSLKVNPKDYYAKMLLGRDAYDHAYAQWQKRKKQEEDLFHLVLTSKMSEEEKVKYVEDREDDNFLCCQAIQEDHRMHSNLRGLTKEICWCGEESVPGRVYPFTVGQVVFFDLVRGWEDMSEEEKDRIASETDKLGEAYRHTYVRGRQVCTTQHAYTKQDPDYKEEAKWARTVSGFATKLRKQQLEQEREWRREDEEDGI